MNKKTKFELDQCINKLKESHDTLAVFSLDINQSIECLEEAVFASDNSYEFSRALDEYEQLFAAYRKLKHDLVRLSKTVIELNGYKCNVVKM